MWFFLCTWETFWRLRDRARRCSVFTLYDPRTSNQNGHWLQPFLDRPWKVIVTLEPPEVAACWSHNWTCLCLVLADFVKPVNSDIFNFQLTDLAHCVSSFSEYSTALLLPSYWWEDWVIWMRSKTKTDDGLLCCMEKERILTLLHIYYRNKILL